MHYNKSISEADNIKADEKTDNTNENTNKMQKVLFKGHRGLQSKQTPPVPTGLLHRRLKTDSQKADAFINKNLQLLIQLISEIMHQWDKALVIRRGKLSEEIILIFNFWKCISMEF